MSNVILSFKLDIKSKVRNAIATSIYFKEGIGDNLGFQGYDDATKKVMKHHDDSVMLLLDDILTAVKKDDKDAINTIENFIQEYDKLSKSAS